MKVFPYVFSTIIIFLCSYVSHGQLVIGTIGNNQTICTSEDPEPIQDGLYFSPTHDAYVSDASATTTYGVTNPTKLEVRSGASGSYRETYLIFNFTNLTAPVNSAFLSLYGGLGNALSDPALIEVLPVPVLTWNENTIHYDNRPTASAVVLASLNITSHIPSEHRFNLTSYIQSEITAGRKIISIMLKTNNPINYSIEFNSKESSSNTPHVIINETKSNCNLSYQWQSQVNCIDGVSGVWSNIPGANAKVYDPPAGLTQTTCYRLFVSDDCARTGITNHVTVTVKTIAGDPSIYGNNEWRVYGYNSVNFTNYRGYYTESSTYMDTRTRWAPTTSPSDALGYQGCPIVYDGHSVSCKRTNFSPGYYRIDITGHDNACYLFIDGVQVFSHAGYGEHKHTGGAWVGRLTATSQVDFRYEEETGNSFGIINIVGISNPNNLTAGSINANSIQCAGVDPTAITSGYSLGVLQDAHVIGGVNANTNYGLSNNLLIQSSASANDVKYTYLMFDISGVTTPVTSAILKLYGKEVAGNVDIDIEVYEVVDTLWTETGINFNNRPSSNAYLDIDNIATEDLQNVYWNITSYIASKKAAGFKKVSLMIRQQTNNIKEVIWNSKESGSAIPELFVNIPNSTCYIRDIQWQQSVGCTGTWTDIPGATSATYDPPAGITQTTCFRKKVTDACENVAYSNTVTTTVISAATPVGTGASRCGAGSVVLSASGSTNGYNWYAASTGGTSIGSGPNFTTPSLTTTTTYYVAATSASGCESATRVAVVATVYSIPSAPSAVGGFNCGPGTVNLTASGAADYKWYTASTGGTSIGTGSPFTTPSISVSTPYYVSAVNADLCESTSRTMVTAAINTIPNVPTANDVSRCGPGTVSLTASGSSGTYNWYSASTGGSSLGTTPNFVTPVLTNTATFYVSSEVSGCESSSRTAVIATIYAVPSAPSVVDGVSCGPGTLTLTATGSSDYKWYTASSGGASIATGSSYTTPVLSSTTQYYVSAVNADLCESTSRTVVNATINSIPPPPTTTDGSLCGVGIVSLSATSPTGIGHQMYTASAGGTLIPAVTSSIVGANITTLFETPILTNTTTYYVSSVQGGCESSSRTAVVATIKNEPYVSFSSEDVYGCPSAELTALGHDSKKVIRLDGMNDHLFVPSGVWFNGNFTVESWVFVRSHTNWSKLLDFGNGMSSDNILISLSDGTTGKINFTVVDGTTHHSIYTPSEITVPLNKWTHIACVLNGATGTIYINGVNVVSGVLAVPNNIVRVSNLIGASNRLSDAATNADIDDLKIWNVARTQAEIQQFMYRPLPINSTGLVALWDMEENTGLTTTDKKGGVVATLQNGASWASPATTPGETYSWSPATGLSATTGKTVTASPTTATMYTVTVTNLDGCTSEASVNYIPGPIGDTSVYGNGEWRVYGFEGTDWNTYKGYYTDPTLSFDSDIRYDELTSPSSASGYIGCSILNDNHSVSYKRTNIPAGTYQIDFILNDDEATLLIDGKVKYIRSKSTTPTTAWIGNLTAASKVEIRWKDINIHSRAVVNFTNVTPPVFSAGTINGSQTICAGLDPLYFNSLSLANGCFISGYQWEWSLDNVIWVPILGATDSIYDHGSLMETTSFRRRAFDDCGRFGFSNEVTIVVLNPLPPATVDGAICGPGTVTLSADGSTGNYVWYDVATGGTSIGSGADFTTPSISMTTNYFVSALDGVCESPRSTVVATINTMPAPPTGINDSRCGDGSVSLSASDSPDSYRWYEDATGGTVLVSTAIFDTPILNASRSYFVSSISAEGCESTSRTEVIASINTATVGGTLSNDAIVCSGNNGSTITLTGYVGNITSWESSLDNFATAGSTITNTSATFDFENLTQTTSYRVVVQAPGCAIVNSSIVTITVNSLPTNPITTGASHCGPGSMTLSATGSPLNYRWYDAAVDGNIVGTGSSFTTPILTVTTDYYAVSLSAEGCESSIRIIATAVINDIPLFPSGTEAKRCGDGTVVLSASGPVTSYNWYDAPSGGLLLSTGSSFTTPTLTETTKYYVSGVSADNCESISRDEVIATVISIPSSPVVSDVNRCGPGKVTLSATGSVSGYNWYDVSTGGSVIETSSTWITSDLMSDKIYYVSSLDDVCESGRVPLNVTIQPASISGSLASDISQVCEGANAVTLTLTGSSGGVVSWLSSSDNFNSQVSTINSTNSQEVVTNLTTSVSYKVIVQNGSCPADTTTSILVAVDPITNSGNLITREVNNEEAVLELIGYEGAIVQWEMSTDDFNTVTIINETSPFLTVPLDSATSYRVVVKSGVCSIAISNDVKVEGFKIYTSITPNNDGVNDLWVIDGIHSYPSNKVRIFNRWGDLVYMEEGYNNKERVWNGSANRGMILDNQPLPDGTYFYQVELSKDTIKTGYVIIKR